jgi:hypothetical protein
LTCNCTIARGRVATEEQLGFYVNKKKALTLLVFLALPNPIYLFLLFIFSGVVDPSIETIPAAANSSPTEETDSKPENGIHNFFVYT